MNLFSRHKNTVVLATVLLAQLLALAVQVKRQTSQGPVRLIRFVGVNTLAPFERLLIYSGESVRGVWSNYLYLRDVRREDERLRAEVGQMQLERAREQEELRQARRIQALLGFKQKWIDTTVAAQVIGTSGMVTSRLLYLDKGAKDGIKPDMPVITPDGLVGKVLNVFGDTSQVLVINDLTSGVGAILVKSRLQGILNGTSTGEVQLNYIMSDESVQPGEQLVTSGGDQVFPKGLPIGTVSKVSLGHNMFLDIAVKPAADLNRLEEVLVITQQKPRAPDAADQEAVRASDILAGQLPGVPVPPPAAAPQPGSPAVPKSATPKPAVPKPATPKPAMPKPASPSGNHSKKPVAAAHGVLPPGVNRPKPKPAAPGTASAGAERPKPKPAANEGTSPQ
jgi:rod shape-determining protein MreC